MAKRKIIWANTAIKKLFVVFESEIRRKNEKKVTAELFKALSKSIRMLAKYPLKGIPSSDESVRVLIIDSLIVCYGLSQNRISIFTISKTSNSTR